MDVFALGLNITEQGGALVIRRLEDIDRKGRETTRTLGGVSTQTRTLSSGFGILGASLQNVAQDFAVTGRVGTREIKSLVRGGTEFALLMGAGGPIVAGIGLTLLTLVTLHGKARAEMEKTAKQHADKLLELQRANDAATTAMAAADFERQYAARINVLTAQLEDAEQKQRNFNESVRQLREEAERAGRPAPAVWGGALQQEIDRIKAELDPLLQKREDFNRLVRDQAQSAERLRVATEIVNEREEARKELERQIAEYIREQESRLRSLEDLRPRLADTFNISELQLEIMRRDITIRIPVQPVLPEGDLFEAELMGDLAAQIETQFRRLPLDLGTTFFEGLGAAWGGGLDSAGDVILGSLGRIATEMGKTLLVMGLAMEGLLPALSNPFTSGPAMIAAGAILLALGAALTSAMTGGGARGGRTYGTGAGRQADVSRFTLGATPATQTAAANVESASQLRPQPIIHIGPVIGARDKQLQRELTETLRLAALRGMRPT
jgi:hypothetical protein